MGHLETFPGLLPHVGEGPLEPCAGIGAGFKIDSSCPHPPKSNSPCAPSVLQLIKTAELDPSHNYLFGFHPHGVLVTGAFGSFCTEATGFSRLFPGLKPHLLMLPCWFYLPLFRDYIMCAGEERGSPASGPPVPAITSNLSSSRLRAPGTSSTFPAPSSLSSLPEDPGVRSPRLCLSPRFGVL